MARNPALNETVGLAARVACCSVSRPTRPIMKAAPCAAVVARIADVIGNTGTVGDLRSSEGLYSRFDG